MTGLNLRPWDSIIIVLLEVIMLIQKGCEFCGVHQAEYLNKNADCVPLLQKILMALIFVNNFFIINNLISFK